MTKKSSGDPRVRASLDALIRLQYQARGYSLLPRQPVHSLLSGRYTSRLRGRGLNFDEIRTYLPGDDVRNMDWKVTARLREPHIRVYTEERDRPLMLVVDQRQCMFFGSRRNTNSVTAAETAALVAWAALDAGDRVGAVVFNDEEIREVSPHRSRGTVMRILGLVAEMSSRLSADSTVSTRPEMLTEALTKASRTVGHDYLVCVVSTFWGADDTTIAALQRMARHNDVIAALIYDRLQTELPLLGRAVVSDGELQIEYDSQSATQRKNIAEFFADRTRRVQDELRKATIPTLRLCNAEDTARQVRRQLGVVAEAR